MHAWIGVALIALTWFTSSRIDVNRFSLHGVYRNRLIRAFLGGARRDQDRLANSNPFTGFDPSDNVHMHKLRAIAPGKDQRSILFPVINVTLNLVGGQNLAWQERKASSFVITPIACGSGALGSKRENDPGPMQCSGAYVSSRYYGGAESDLESEDAGISLGTAMTISGAAVSPSQGYNSTPATAFLMTLFNVRLGAWLANPSVALKGELRQTGPTNSLLPLLSEMFGWTNDRGKNVYLSDGGHFDNLGIYEMLRRRCKYILVVDADEDRRFAFEDLGKAVRQAYIDFEAEIEFERIEMKPRADAKADSPTFAVGKIRYGKDPRGTPGTLVYLKPTYFLETVPVDVRSYGTVNQDFPHESTLDQFFGESQFESYRRLGFYLASQLDRDEKAGSAASNSYRQVKSFFSEIEKRAKRKMPPPSVPQEAVTLPPQPLMPMAEETTLKRAGA